MQRTVQRLPLAALAAQLLREGVEQGRWGAELPGERHLSDQLGVSRPTLRSALTLLSREGLLSVSHGRATRILLPGPRGASPRPGVVVLLSPVPLEAMPPLAMYWLAEVRANLAAVGTTLELDVMRASAAGLPDRMLEQHVRRRPGALWLLYLSTGAVQRWFRDRGVPCVVAGSCAPGIRLTSVDIDQRATSRNAAGRMFARGCRRPALLRPEGDHPGEHESEAGFREAWERSRSAAGDPLVLRHDGSVASVCARLDAAIRSKAGADGFLVSRSRHALTALTHLARRGVRVPQDMPLVSRDDDAYLDFVVPRVARYSAEPAEFARRLSRAVRARLLAEEDGFRRVRLLPRFIPGETL